MAEDSPARQYEVGVRYNGIFEDDPAFYLFATAGVYHEEDILGLDPESTNWIGFVGIGPKRGGKRDIAIAFRGTQASGGMDVWGLKCAACFAGLPQTDATNAWTLAAMDGLPHHYNHKVLLSFVLLVCYITDSFHTKLHGPWGKEPKQDARAMTEP